MAYEDKYLFKFESVHGIEYEIYIQQDDYEGDVIQRALGRAPVLKKSQNGPIHGTSLELYAECIVDGEFSGLYTSNPQEYRVMLYRAGSLIWTGFVSTEIYSEPSIAPPYDIQIVATDGLGELKLVNYEAQGEVTLGALFTYLLSFTGYTKDFYFATNLMKYGATKQEMVSWRIDLDFLAEEEKTCYDVLTQILDTLHATITTYNNRWLIARETDIATLMGNTYWLNVFTYSQGTTGTATIRANSVGQMYAADLWPNGYYSTSIEPARKEVAVFSEWHLKNCVFNPELDYNLGGWYLSSEATWNTAGYIALGHNLAFVNNTAWIRQQIGTILDSEIKFKVRAAGIAYSLSDYKPILAFSVKYETANETYYGDSIGWETSAPSKPRSPIELLNANFYGNHYGDYEATIQAPPVSDPGLLTIYIHGRAANVDSVDVRFQPISGYGYKDVIHIDNAARGDADTKEIFHGRITAEEFVYTHALVGAFKEIVSGVKSYIYKFSDSHYNNGDFLAITALSYALSVALPRLRNEGIFDTGEDVFNEIPPVLSFGGIKYWVETFEWDLLKEDVRISALSLPAASLTIESEEVIPMTGSSSGGGSGSGGSGGGSGSGGSSSGVSMSDVAAYVGDQGFMTEVTAQDVEGALGYTPASTEDLASLGVGLQAPSLKIYRGYDAQGQTTMVPSLKVYHPLLNSASINAECVLMVWRKRRGRRVVSTGHPQSIYISRWGEARGSHATTAPLTFSRSKAIDDILQWILNTAVEGGGFTRAQMESMTLATFKAYDSSYKFGFKVKGGGVYSILKRSRLYGIAIRYENPAWADCVSGPVAETTRQLKSDPTTYVDRYIYSEVAPIKIHINPNWSGYWRIGIQLQALLGPTK